MINPLVSIIIPIYNIEKYLPEAIESAINQTWQNKEILLIDDDSTDNSLTIAKRYENESIKVFHQKNKGASAARNRGLKEAKGKYIQFLDADDLLSAKKIEYQVSALNGTVDKLAVCSTIHFNSNQNPYSNKPSPYEERFVRTTDDPVDFIIRLWGGYDFEASMIQTNAWLVPKSLIEKYGNWNENISLDDDGEFFARMVLNSNGIIKTFGYNYYRKFSAMSKNLSAKKDSIFLKSALDSALLKKQYLFTKSKSKPAEQAVYKQLKELQIKCFPAESELLKIINNELSYFPNYKYNIQLGGIWLNSFKKVFGWKLAKLLQFLFTRIKHRLNHD